MPSRYPLVNLESLLTVCRRAIADIDGALHASVARASGGQLDIVVSTDCRLDLEISNGPTTTALKLNRISLLPTNTLTDEFPDYALACRAAGIGSVASVPIRAGNKLLAVLTVTSADHHGFSANDLRRLRDAAVNLSAHLQTPAYEPLT
ncbi:MAG: hypothetical protein JWM34_3722 [Ilumatobacteraceae bacterium]|nr:hypothetical protein [Ilumatobacteraceae bacterium]